MAKKASTKKEATKKEALNVEGAKTVYRKVSNINRIDFMALIWVSGANPNGNPSDRNYPRIDSNGLGVMTNVCLKRKLRNRIQDMGDDIYIQTDERCSDGCTSLEQRLKERKYEDLDTEEEYRTQVCCDWYDVRAFGQVFAFAGASFGIRGPVTIQHAKSVDPVEVETYSITKSVNGKETKGMASDRMGENHVVKSGLYVLKGSINPRYAEKTGFDEEDVEKLKEALCTMFEGDESSARPAGTMSVEQVYWWDHGCKNGKYSANKVFDQLKIEHEPDVIPSKFSDYKISVDKLEGLEMKELI